MRGAVRGAWLAVLLPLLFDPTRGVAETDTIPVASDKGRLEAELATTPRARQRGLMGRKELGEDRGMLFVWPQAAPRAFWMKDTPLALSVAFLDRRGRVINIETMTPLQEDVYYHSRRPARFALEAEQGWFRRHGIEPGDRFRFRIPAVLLSWKEEALVVGGP